MSNKIMKKILIIVFAILLLLFSTGCMNVKYNFSYDYDSLRNNLVRAELIYFDEETTVFLIHGFEYVSESAYRVIEVFSEEDFDKLVDLIADIPFRYSVLYVVASVSAVYTIDGYAIALHYENNSRIIIGRTAEHRTRNMRSYGQAISGRYAVDRVWNGFINNVLLFDFASDNQE